MRRTFTFLVATALATTPVLTVHADAPNVYPPASLYMFPAATLGPKACLPIDGGCASFLRYYAPSDIASKPSLMHQVYEYAVTPIGFAPVPAGAYARGSYQIRIYDSMEGPTSEQTFGSQPSNAVNSTERLDGGASTYSQPGSHQCAYQGSWNYRNVSVTFNIEVYPVHPPCVKSLAWERKASHTVYNATVRYAAMNQP